MTGFGVSAYRQAETNWETKKAGEKHAGAALPGKERTSSASENAASKVQVKAGRP